MGGEVNKQRFYMLTAGVVSSLMVVGEILNDVPENAGMFIDFLVLKSFIDLFIICVLDD